MEVALHRNLNLNLNQIYHISAWQSQWRHRLWRRELHMNLSRVSAALYSPRSIVPRPHYSSRPKRFGPCGPSEVNWPRGTGKTPYRDSATFTYIHVHFSHNMNFEKNYYLAPRMARFARNDWGKGNRQLQEKLYQICLTSEFSLKPTITSPPHFCREVP